MKNRHLGKNGFEVSEVGLGCWQLGSDWGSEISKKKAFEILNKAVDCGITFFDTADVYGGGRSEELIGEFLQTSNSEVKVATKFGRKSDLFPDNYSEQALRECVDDSRRRLQVDCIDLLQLHCLPTAVLKSSRIFDWLRNLKAEGKIAHFGASVESVEQGLICLGQEGLQSLQVIYNIFRQKLNEELLPLALKKGVGIIVRLPLASGLLTGKFTQQSKFSATDHRHYNRDGAVFNVGETFAGLPFDIGVQLSEELKTLFPQDSSVSKVALRWLLDHEAVSTVIPGASSPAQVYENASASDLPSLDEKLRNDLKDFYKKHVADHIRGVY